MTAPSIQSRLGAIIEPTPGRIAVLVKVHAERTPTGLLLPEDTVRSIHEERPTQGIVVAIHPDDLVINEEKHRDETEEGLALGDRVVFGKYTGTKLEWQPNPNDRSTKEKVVIMSGKDVLCKLVEPEELSDLKVRV
jgi:co-chaperonin GroES (HSP10)